MNRQSPPKTDTRFQNPLLGIYWPTESIQGLHHYLTVMISSGAAGGCVLGNARVGKTSAIQFLMQQSAETTLAIPPSFCCSVYRLDRPTVREAYKLLAESLGISLRRQATASDLRSDIISFFLEQFHKCEQQAMVVFVDEFQRLNTDQLDVFVSLYDHFAQQEKRRLFFCMVGNTGECSRLIESIQLPSLEHARGRFFMNIYKFVGITTSKGLRSILERYDTEAIPLLNDSSFVGHMFPERYNEGWRIASLSSQLWAAFREHCANHGISANWGMAWLSLTVLFLLRGGLDEHAPEVVSDKTLIDTIALAQSAGICDGFDD